MRHHGMPQAFNQWGDELAVTPGQQTHTEHTELGRNKGHSDDQSFFIQTRGGPPHEVEVGHHLGPAKVKSAAVHFFAPRTKTQ